MITIQVRKIEVNEVGFKNELRIYARLIKKHSPNTLGISASSINSHFGTKLKITDFYLLSEKLNLKIHMGKYWYIDDILKS